MGTNDVTTLAFTNDVLNAMVCRDRDDFTKFFMQIVDTISKRREDDELDKKECMELNIAAIQMLLHDYLSLVLANKLEPYKMEFASDEDKDACIKTFRSEMIHITEHLMKSGVPTYEDNAGRTRIDFDGLKEEYENNDSEK